MLKSWPPTLRGHPEQALRQAGMAERMEDFWRNPFDASPFPEGFRNTVYGQGARISAADVAGTDKEITLGDGALVIRGGRTFADGERKDNAHRIERGCGSFMRGTPLPGKAAAEGVAARFGKGVPRVTLPEAEASSPARKIGSKG